MTFVKICGVRRDEDVDACLGAGADAIGINLVHASPRFADATTARALAQRIAGRALVVWVIADAPPSFFLPLLGEFSSSLVQRCDPAWAWPAAFEARRRIEVVRLIDDATVTAAAALFARFVISDAPGALGGSGKRADWTLTKQLAQRRNDVLIAGGLRAESVKEALVATGAHGADVAGGVESAPGVKDATAIRRFVEAARG